MRVCSIFYHTVPGGVLSTETVGAHERKHGKKFISSPRAVDSGGGTCYSSFVYLQQETLKIRQKTVKRHKFNTKTGGEGQCLDPARTDQEEELP